MKIAQEVSPLLTEFSNDVALNSALFERVKAVYNTKESLSLTEEQKTLLDDSKMKTLFYHSSQSIKLPIYLLS